MGKLATVRKDEQERGFLAKWEAFDKWFWRVEDAADSEPGPKRETVHVEVTMSGDVPIKVADEAEPSGK